MSAEKTVKKHVAIIHTYSLMSVLQRKIFNVLLYEASKGGRCSLNSEKSVSVEYRIPFSNLTKAIKFNSNNTQYLKESIDELASLKIEWNLLKDKVPMNISFLNLRILHGPPTFYQDSTINFSFHKILLDLVENSMIYGTVDIDLQSQFESKYSHSLYENSTRFVNLQKNNKVLSLETFRKLLCVPEKKYSSVRELTRNVIMPAVEEVNDRADFVVGIDGIKSGRKITGFELSVTGKKKSSSINKKIDTLEKEKARSEIKNSFAALSSSVLEDILSKYSQEYILEKIEYTKKYAKKDASGLYPIPYFIRALKDNYKPNESHKVENSYERLPDEKEIQWQDELCRLHYDIAHWKRMLSYSRDNEGVRNILLSCESRLQQYLLNRPAHKKEEIA